MRLPRKRYQAKGDNQCLYPPCCCFVDNTEYIEGMYNEVITGMNGL